MAKKITTPKIAIPANVIGLPVKNKRISGKSKVFTCSCGGQLFIMFQNGKVVCHGCRTPQTLVNMRMV